MLFDSEPQTADEYIALAMISTDGRWTSPCGRWLLDENLDQSMHSRGIAQIGQIFVEFLSQTDYRKLAKKISSEEKRHLYEPEINRVYERLFKKGWTFIDPFDTPEYSGVVENLPWNR